MSLEDAPYIGIAPHSHPFFAPSDSKATSDGVYAGTLPGTGKALFAAPEDAKTRFRKKTRLMTFNKAAAHEGR